MVRRSAGGPAEQAQWHAAALRRPPNGEESGARVPMGLQPRLASAAPFLL